MKIKEFVKETRILTEDEKLIYNLWKAMSRPNYSSAEIQRHWNKTGFDFVYYNGNEGTFNREIIRDATHKEKIAYYCIKIHHECMGFAFCDNCPKQKYCIQQTDYEQSMELLKNKEIILI